MYFKVKRLLKSFVYASRGLIQVIRREQNFRLELTAAALVILGGWYYHFRPGEWAVAILTIGFVLLMEVVNSLVELLSDLLKPKLDHYVKAVKDVGAAAVLLAAVVAVTVGWCLFSPHWFN